MLMRWQWKKGYLMRHKHGHTHLYLQYIDAYEMTMKKRIFFNATYTWTHPPIFPLILHSYPLSSCLEFCLNKVTYDFLWRILACGWQCNFWHVGGNATHLWQLDSCVLYCLFLERNVRNSSKRLPKKKPILPKPFFRGWIPNVICTFVWNRTMLGNKMRRVQNGFV